MSLVHSISTLQHIYEKKKPVHGIHETRTPQNVPVNETILDPTV